VKIKIPVELGLAVAGLSLQPGEISTYARMQFFISAADPLGRTISRERLRQIEAKALRKLRKKLRSRPELMQELEQRRER